MRKSKVEEQSPLFKLLNPLGNRRSHKSSWQPQTAEQAGSREKKKKKKNNSAVHKQQTRSNMKSVRYRGKQDTGETQVIN